MSMPENRNYFAEFKGDCDVWVESGTYTGAGVKLAYEAGFREIYTIDIHNYTIEELPAIRYFDDSATVFSWLLPRLKGRNIQFWLDGHSQLTEDEPDNFPLIRELEAIEQSGIYNATILIDDFLYMSHKDITGWDKVMIEEAIKTINPSYEISYLPNPIKNNILIARL